MQSKAEHRDWVRKFFEGSFLVSGWNRRVEDLLDGVETAKKRAELKRKLDRLGRLIANEWAKESDVRKIDSDDLKHWGSLLDKRRRNGVAALEEALREVEHEVRTRLA